MHCGNRLKPERFLDKPRFFEGRLAAAMQLNDKTLGVFENHGASCLACRNSPSSTTFELVSGHKIEGSPAEQNSRAIGRESLPLLLGVLKLELA